MSRGEGHPFLLTGPLDADINAWTLRNMTNRPGMIAAVRGQLQETRWLSEGEQLDRRSAKLGPVLRHCDAHSPWFRSRLLSLGLTCGDFLEADGLARLPVM